MKKLILLSGKKRSGKDTVFSFLKQHDPSVRQVSFANGMKQILAVTFDIPLGVLEDYKNEGYVCMHGIPAEDQEDANFMAQSYREILQRFGTEAMKPIFGNDVWTKVATKQVDHWFNFTDIVVITDLRFPEEITGIQEAYANEDVQIITVRINRDGFSEDSHISETALDNYEYFTHTISNNGTLEELKEKVTNVFN